MPNVNLAKGTLATQIIKHQI